MYSLRNYRGALRAPVLENSGIHTAEAAAASPEATPLPMLADVSQHVSQC